MLQFSLLSSLAHIEHGITEVDEDPLLVAGSTIIMGEQVHKNAFAWVEEVSSTMVRGVDAVGTHAAQLTLGVRVADCIPLLFAQTRPGIVGVIHAGWRGTALEISRKVIESLGVPAAYMAVGVGPGICPDCFEVGEEVARQFPPEVVRESDVVEGKFHVDLWQANVLQLLEVGVPERQIEVLRVCTVETPTLHSFRRGDRDQRQVGFIRKRI